MTDRLTAAHIDLHSFVHNINMLRQLVGDTVELMAIVKANAYGHGIEEMGKAAVRGGAVYLGVVSLGELKLLRKAGIDTPILLLNYIDPYSVAEVIDLDGSFTVMDSEVIKAAIVAAKANQKIARIHIKVDTGMHRAGCNPEQLLGLAKSVQDCPYLELEGVFTHLAESEALDTSFTNQQLRVFNECLSLLSDNNIRPRFTHCANSAAIINFPESHFNLVRPGLISYGLNPFSPEHPKYQFVEENFKPILALKSQVIYVRTIEAGETVGYNRRWRAGRTSKVALLPVGYGDGYRRSPQNAGAVLIKGQQAPIIGSVSMDQTVVDVTDIEDISVGDEVVLLGRQGDVSITARDIAETSGTVNYEVLTALADRIERAYSGVG